MKDRTMAQSMTVVILLVLCLLANAQVDHTPLVYYRDATGHVTQNSKDTAKRLAQTARKAGQVKLWLTLDYPFNIYFDEMTPEEIAAQEQAVSEGMNEILAPLLRQQHVKFVSGGPTFYGPTVGVWATPGGLRRLLTDERILQISGARAQP